MIPQLRGHAALPMFHAVSLSEWPHTVRTSLRELAKAGARMIAEAEPRPSHLPPVIDHDRRNGLLTIEITGPLDLRSAFRLLEIADTVDDTVVACRLGLDGVTRVFDSGVAAVMALINALTKKGVSWICIDGPGSEGRIGQPTAAGRGSRRLAKTDRDGCQSRARPPAMANQAMVNQAMVNQAMVNQARRISVRSGEHG